MPYLSRNQIEQMADNVISRYRAECVPEKRLCYRVDPAELASLLGFRIDFQYLSIDGTVLGVTSSYRAWVETYFPDNSKAMYELDGHTLLIEKRLQLYPTLKGRRNFTIAHELSHQIINRTFPEEFGVANRLCCDYRRSTPRGKITDWYEWQADALASALILPPDAIKDAMFLYGLGEKMTVLSRKYSAYKFEQFCQMADFLEVSRTALSYRMEQLGLLERNLLVKEAKERGCLK